MEPIILHEKRHVSGKSLLFCIVMLAASVYLIYFGLHEGGFFYLLIGIAGTLYFLYCLILMIAGRLRTTPILTADSEGLTQSSLTGKPVLIPWEEIADVQLIRRMKDDYLGIRLRDEEAFLTGQGRLAQERARANRQLSLPPVMIRVQDAVELRGEPLVSRIKEYIPAREGES